MLITVLVVIVCAAALTMLTSAIIWKSSSRPAVWNMAFAVLFAIAAIAVLAIIAAIVAWFSAREVFHP